MVQFKKLIKFETGELLDLFLLLESHENWLVRMRFFIHYVMLKAVFSKLIIDIPTNLSQLSS